MAVSDITASPSMAHTGMKSRPMVAPCWPSSQLAARITPRLRLLYCTAWRYSCATSCLTHGIE